MQFSDLEFEPHTAGLGGVQARHFFPNGYGASIVRGLFSYGGSEGLYELAVLNGNTEKWTITYDTPITDDVCGYLAESAVVALLDQIAALPTTEPEQP